MLAFFGGLIVVCVAVTLVSVRLMTPDKWAHDEAHGHQWLHELGLTDAEAAQIDTFEAPYRKARRSLEDQLNAHIAGLAQLLENQDSFSPEVAHAVHELHLVHGQLQQLAIEHYFEMLSVLPPEKQAALRKLAVEALSTPQ